MGHAEDGAAQSARVYSDECVAEMRERMIVLSRAEGAIDLRIERVRLAKSKLS